MDTRVEDYLNDKFQTEADLESLDALLETAKHQQALLKRQLDEANAALGEASDLSAQRQSNLQHELSSFQNQQASIDIRLQEVTGADDIDEAVSSFAELRTSLQNLDVASAYLELLEEVDRLATTARQNLRKDPRSAISNYARLKSIVVELGFAQNAAEGAAPHLIDDVEQKTKSLWEQMRKVFGDDLQKTLDDMSWPNKDLKLEKGLLERWEEQVGLLLDLQVPDLRPRDTEEPHQAQHRGPAVLLPLEVMVHPLDLRFRYHFNGDKPTNRLDKPEYFLSHIVDLLEAHNDFLLDYFQPILDRQVSQTDIEVNLAYSDATTAFITALLPIVRQKCLNMLPQVVDSAQLLSHFVHELMEFDTTIRDTWDYSPTASPRETWKGLTWEMLVTHNYFNPWFEAEKSFAISRYHGIISAPDSGEIDYDSPLPGTTKPTKGAIRVNDLLETITDRYRPLYSFSHKLRFVIDIQLEIFDQYHRRLHGSLEAYLTMTSTVGRVMTGSTSKDPSTDLSGTKGLDRLCRVFGSAEYLERKMLDWSDDVFFVELWDELEERARQNAGTSRSVARDMSVSHIASRTSAAVINGGGSNVAEGEKDGGALFDETASAYHRLRTRSESLILEAVENSVRSSFQSYSKISTWSSLATSTTANASSGGTAPSISSEVTETLQTIDAQLEFLAAVLAKAPLRRVTRQLCLSLQSYIWDFVLMRNSFSAGGAATLYGDVEAIWNVIDRHTGSNIAESVMKKLRDALGLLCLPAGSQPTNGEESNGAAEGDDAWGFDEDESSLDTGRPSVNDMHAQQDSSEAAQSLYDASQAQTWNLWDVEKRVFRSNDSAREALRLLGLDTLSESEGRNVLGRRIELQK